MSDADSTDSTARIDDPAALGALVRDCRDKQLPIVDYGHAHRGLGHPPPSRHVRLVQSGGVLEHYQRDLTVRVAAGASIEVIQQTLAATRQFLPIDADADLSLGEVLMHNLYGPLRSAYGALRDLLLGLCYIDGHGQEIHVGGRTVKNVAGYDLTRFMVGGLGQFGQVYEATLRTYAMPEEALTAQVAVDDPSLVERILTDLILSDATPAWITLQPSDQAWRLNVGYYGRATANSVQLEALEQFMADQTGMQVMASSTCPVIDDMAQRQQQRAWRRSAAAVVKLIVPPAMTGHTCQLLKRWADENQRLQIDALPAHGCIFAGGELTASETHHLDGTINTAVLAHQGLRVWFTRPVDGELIDPFAPPQQDWDMLTRLKRTLDPMDLFNPGRFVPTESI